ncbi:MAG: glycoside hydrolase family 88 protein [Chloroflexi bacterium]|nr:glycoside hydrolase family 88 protein [Chloroflexota bacterium]
MSIAERIDALAREYPDLWTLDACGVTRADTQIPALLHPDAYVPDTDRTRVLLLSGLTGRTAGVGNGFRVLESYAGLGESLQRDVALSAIPCANPDGYEQGTLLGNGAGGNPSTDYPPRDNYYYDHNDPEARYLWRWIAFHAPDIVLEVREAYSVRWEYAGPIERIANSLGAYPMGKDGTLVAALSEGKPSNLAPIPSLTLTCPADAVEAEVGKLWRIFAQASALSSSLARREMDKRRNRSPIEAARILAGAYGHKLNPVIYTQGVALSGRLRLFELDPDGDYPGDGPVADIERMVRGYAVSSITDVFGHNSGGANLAGLVYADELAAASGNANYNDLLIRAADERFRPVNASRIPPAADDDYRVEDMFFNGAVLGRAQAVTGDTSYLDIQTRFLLDAAVQQDDGLFWHCDNAAWYWGRGNGFAALGYSETLTYLPEDHADRDALVSQHRRHLTALLDYQQPSGMWRQIIDFPGSYQEMTVTCMVGYAMARGMRLGWLDESYADALALAWQGVSERIDDEGGLVDVCTGTGVMSSTREYLDRPAIFGWDERGGAMALWFACEMERYLRHVG